MSSRRPSKAVPCTDEMIERILNEDNQTDSDEDSECSNTEDYLEVKESSDNDEDLPQEDSNLLPSSSLANVAQTSERRTPNTQQNITQQPADYIKPCSRDDPNLNECALNSARESLNRYSQGEPSRNLKPLDPLYVPEMTVFVPNEQGLKLVFKENNFTGLANLDLVNLKFNLDKKIITAEALVNLSVKSFYDLTGRILIVPVDSSGDASIKLKNTTLYIRLWYEHVQCADGEIHWNIIKHDVKYEVGKAIFRLENILNDKNIGDQVNKLLNELWREIVADVGPTISKAMCAAVVENLQALLEQVPYDLLMPPANT